MTRFAIFGYGNIGRRHAEEILAHPEGELAAIIDISPEALANAEATHPDVPRYKAIEDFLLSDNEADIASICTPNGLHVTHAVHALEGGMHVLTEKPIGLHSGPCEALLSLAKQNGKMVFPVLQNRFSAPARLLRSLREERKLGRIFWVEVACYWNRDNRYYTPGGWRGTLTLDGGPLYTQFSHFVDILHWCFGPLEVRGAHFLNANHKESTEFEDTGAVTFGLPQGGGGIFTYSTCAFEKNLESSLTVLGEKGMLKIGGQYMETLEYFHVEGMEAPSLEASATPNLYAGYQGSANHHAQVIHEVIQSLQGKESNLATAEEAIASVRFIEEAYRRREL